MVVLFCKAHPKKHRFLWEASVLTWIDLFIFSSGAWSRSLAGLVNGFLEILSPVLSSLHMVCHTSYIQHRRIHTKKYRNILDRRGNHLDAYIWNGYPLLTHRQFPRRNDNSRI